MSEPAKISVKEYPQTNTVELSSDTFDWIVKSRNNLLDTLRTLHGAFEQDNEHFMATFIEAIQHSDVESALKIHELYEGYVITGVHNNDFEDLIDERERIRKRWKQEK